MSGFANDVVNAIGVITRQVMKSVNYIAGVDGWAIFRNGNAEFNSGTFRGALQIGPDAGPDLLIGSTVPTVVSDFYFTNYLGAVGAFAFLLKVDNDNYYYQVLLTSSDLGPAFGRGWVIAGALKEEYFSYFDGTQLVAEFAGDGLTQEMEWVLGKGKMILGTGDPTDSYADLIFNNISLPRGLVFMERVTGTLSTTAATTEQKIFTSTLAWDFPTGRAYMVEVIGQIFTAGAVPVRTRIRVRKGTGTGGTLLVSPALNEIDSASTDIPVYVQGIFVNTSGANVNTKLTITFQNTAAQVISWDGGTGAPNVCAIRVTDIGDTAFYTGVSL